MAKGIFKRGNTYWIRYADFDGIMKRESVCSKSFKEAEDLLLKRKQGVRENKISDVIRISNPTFREVAIQYLEYSKHQKAFRSKKNHVSQLLPAFGNMRMAQFNTFHIDKYQMQRLEKGNKPATINRLLATLRHIFTKASEWDMVSEEVLKSPRNVTSFENETVIWYLKKFSKEFGKHRN